MAMNLFNLSRPQLERWKTGDVVEHRHLNESLDAIDELTRGVGNPREIVRKADLPEITTQTRFMVLIGEDIQVVPSGTGLIAREVSQDDDGAWSVSIPYPESIRTWPNTTDRHYQDLFAREVPPIGDYTLQTKHHVVPVVLWDDEWYAVQMLRFAIGGPTGGGEYGDCVPPPWEGLS